MDPSLLAPLRARCSSWLLNGTSTTARVQRRLCLSRLTGHGGSVGTAGLGPWTGRQPGGLGGSGRWERRKKKKVGKIFRKGWNVVNPADTRQMQDLSAGQRRQRGSECGPKTLDSPLSASVRIASSKWRSAGRVRQHPSDLDVTAKPSEAQVQSL